MTMKLLVLGEDYDRSESAWISSLFESGMEVTVLGNAPTRFPFRIPPERYVPTQLRAKIDPAYMGTLRAFLRSNSFDVIHAITGKALSNLLLSMPFLQTPITTYRGTMGHVSRWDPTSWITYLHPRVKKIVCVSQAVERYFLSLGVAPGKLTTVYKGHDPVWYEGCSTIDLSSFGVPRGAPLISCVGALRPVKGVDVLIRAFHEIPDRFGAHLILIGSVVDKNLYRVAEQGRAAARVHFIGERTDAPQIVARTDIFCMASIEREGLARAAIEAMSRGVCPVVTNVGGMPELVRHEQDGLVVAPSSVEELAEALQRLLSDTPLRERLGESARDRISSTFHIQQTASRMRELFLTLSSN